MHVKYFRACFIFIVNTILSSCYISKEERAETDSTGFLTVEFDPDLAVRKQWGLY